MIPVTDPGDVADREFDVSSFWKISFWKKQDNFFKASLNKHFLFEDVLVQKHV